MHEREVRSVGVDSPESVTGSAAGRPRGPGDRVRRMRAYEAFAGGMRKAEIARELGVTRTTVTYWARKDEWDKRLGEVVRTASEAVDFELANRVADIIARLRAKMQTRVNELEVLCSDARTHPATRLRAIQAWLKLAGVERALPDPVAPGKKKELELIADLLEKPNAGLADGPDR